MQPNNLIPWQTILDLKMPFSEYVIFGSAPMSAHHLRRANDLEMIVTDDLYSKLALHPKAYTETRPSGSKLLIINKLRINKDASMFYAPEYPGLQPCFNNSEVLYNLNFINLPFLLTWKQEVARPKDLTDVQLIKEHLTTCSCPVQKSKTRSYAF